MDRSRSPKRKRRRAESATPRRGRKKGTPGSGGSAESQIVWKDSPADKQIKVSGTGKMAVRREMQGFVGRLARASQQSPPSSQEEDKKPPGRERVRARRKAAEEEKATSRFLLFSPEKTEGTDGAQKTPNATRRRRSTERGDSQDELFSVLDQMEQKYASPDVALPLMGSRPASPRRRQLYQQPAVASTATANDMNLTATPAPSYSSTGTLSPRSLRTQEASKTQEMTRNQQPTKALTPIREQQTEKPVVVVADSFEDLTDESWALMDQLVSQRATVDASQTQSQSQTELVSSQSFALTPRPMPSAAFDGPKRPSPLPPAKAPASVVRPMRDVGAVRQLERPESYRRFLVLEVDRDVINRSLLLRLLDDQDVQLEAVLTEDWFDVHVEAGDTINIVFTEQDRNGLFSQDGNNVLVVPHSSRIQVDNMHNVVVVHPDILVSPTRVTTSFGCLRRAVIQETLAVSGTTGEKAFLGTLKHDLFEYAVRNGLYSAEGLFQEAKRIVHSNILGLVECGLNEEKALLELQRVIEDYRSWVGGAIAGSGTMLNEVPRKNGSYVRVSRVLATEEMMWSIKWGLKGATDASVEGTIIDPGNTNAGQAGSGVLPLELKTGSKKYAGVEHQGQVILYTLLLSERYRQQCQDGLLIYVPPIETNRITAMATHVRGLIMARNHFASAIAKVKAIGSSTSAQVFPPMIQNRTDCERCFQLHECVLHHAAMENGKTATIAFTVRVLLFLGFSVLVTSYTHSAVDNLLLKLLAHQVPMLRIGNTAQVHPLITDFTLDRLAEREGISSVQAMEATMVNAQLVGCTCLSVNSHVLFAKRRFDFCIVDEATQITQPIVLSALRSADTFVLVGDHYQLPPLVANAQARKEGMDVSLFRRLAEAHPEATQQLSYQYRMNRDIMLLANRLVYGDKLKCGSFKVASNHLKLKWQRQNTIGQKLSWPIQVLTNNHGVMFLDTDTMGGSTAESSGTTQMGSNGRRIMENVVEAQVVAGLVELLVLGSMPAEEIAVISPFRSQVALIQQHLTAVAALLRAGGSEWVHSVEVSTIDKYQGKDKGVILVSFVRCNEEKHVGELLTDWRRINVALTRAKQKLLLVGSQSTLSGGSALFHVLSDVIQKQQWGYKLPRDAVETLRQFAVSVATPIEPDPEQGTMTGRRSADNVKVSVLQRSAASSSGDIESLVPNVSSVPLRPRQGGRPPQMKPISRDIFGEM
ncbi:hypothetical protein PR001_g524 [Phytophthora rubi]|uniref:DNA replication ATP-dependent helicase/nuclease n=1 Tax=Phytophthora rubi TaxID=129364 RepID=A0A6A3PDE1_9STRA|nr:hypothetical protein PR001_g524 [Phytophthora rubi]